MLFISPQKLFSLSRYSIFCPNNLYSLEKWADLKVKLNFEICDVTDGNADNKNRYINQYLKT